MTVDLTMYNHQIIEYTNNEEISLTPEYPIEVTLSNGLKEESNADYLIDGDMTTQALFKAATMHVTVETPM